MAKKIPFKKEILKLYQNTNIMSNINSQSYKKLMAKCKKDREIFFYKIPL